MGDCGDGSRSGSDDLASRYPNRLQAAKGAHVVTTTIEHEAVVKACQGLEKKGGGVPYVEVCRGGRVDPEAIRRAVRAETVLITVMHANNELGTAQRLEGIGKIAAGGGVFFHTDAVQSAGKMPINVGAMKIDLLSISGHKIYGPK